MDFIKNENKYILRLDKGEEIVSTLADFCKENSITLGKITGLGSTNKVKIGLFNTHTKRYSSKEFTGDFEIVNLTGNISTMNKEPYLHIHATISDSNLDAFGGHLNYAIISGTAEIIIESLPGYVDREFSEEIGLNLFKFIKE
ncbi:MAG TPA: DNA-binding protein [Defluviitoga sp.]|nr:DNA-binding protein [Defluviitoga sp.]HOP24910.1 DNA-binding protein [Defluviitoga sp.]HPU59957.1 DNA-binding protein [Defluviitoga tunisiensis]HPZ29219.1 DNA-binding protein [Defluviitoga sp.]HQD63174.1 DNA-binding protein [Defluviitoga sp.]